MASSENFDGTPTNSLKNGLSGETKEPAPAEKVEDSGPPDGGTTAWLVVLGAWCCSFCSPGWINSMFDLRIRQRDR